MNYALLFLIKLEASLVFDSFCNFFQSFSKAFTFLFYLFCVMNGWDSYTCDG